MHSRMWAYISEWRARMVICIFEWRAQAIAKRAGEEASAERARTVAQLASLEGWLRTEREVCRYAFAYAGACISE